jgi:hypothetical protein
MRSLILTLTVLLCSMGSVMAASDHYDNQGKLYTVVGCVAVILLIIILALFALERRIKKMEDQLKD